MFKNKHRTLLEISRAKIFLPSWYPSSSSCIYLTKFINNLPLLRTKASCHPATLPAETRSLASDNTDSAASSQKQQEAQSLPKPRGFTLSHRWRHMGEKRAYGERVSRQERAKQPRKCRCDYTKGDSQR